MDLTQRHILLTGASRGIGRAWALARQQAGAQVIATCRNPADAPELTEAGIRVEALDVTSDESVAALLAGVAVQGAVAHDGGIHPTGARHGRGRRDALGVAAADGRRARGLRGAAAVTCLSRRGAEGHGCGSAKESGEECDC